MTCERCVGCNAPIETFVQPVWPKAHVDIAAKPVQMRASLGEPFPIEMSLTYVQCRQCGTDQAVFVNDAYPDRVEQWRAGNEVVAEGRDYILTSYRGKQLDPFKRMVVAFGWLPLPDEELSFRLFEAIKSDELLRRRDLTSLLVLDERRVPDWAPEAAPHFDSCIVLKPHVFAGGYGPYPSLRAERSLHRTFQAKLERVRHYWPAASFNRNDYIPLASDDELLRRWGHFTRANIHFEVRKDNP